MMPEIDEGTVNISIETRPGLTIEEQDRIFSEVEAIITADPELEDYMLTSSSGTGSITAYLSPTGRGPQRRWLLTGERSFSRWLTAI